MSLKGKLESPDTTVSKHFRSNSKLYKHMKESAQNFKDSYSYYMRKIHIFKNVFENVFSEETFFEK